MSAIRTLLEFNFNAFNSVRPKLLVISHERSGTHFLMNSLAANFGYIAQPYTSIDWGLGVNYFSTAAFKDLFENFRNHSIANIFKSHHTLDFYRDFLPQAGLGFKTLYIYRDVHEVMVSYYHHLKGLAWNEGPHEESFSTFLRQAPEGGMTRYQYHHASSMVDRWVRHVESALEARTLFAVGDFIMVSYRELNQEFDRSLLRIAQHLQAPCPVAWTRPGRKQNVVPPVLGLSPEETLDYYTQEDLDFVEQVAGATRRRLEAITQSMGSPPNNTV